MLWLKFIRWIPTAMIFMGFSACGVAPQPESAKTVTAFEIPLPLETDRNKFLSVLRGVAESEGLHVDAATEEELEQQSSVGQAFRMTMNATVWKGEDDDEPIASAMDFHDHLGQVWLTFSKGEDPLLNGRFREAAMREIMQNWPETLSLPIMPTGAIPLSRDLVRTQEGYVVKPTEAHRYQLPEQPR